MALTTGQRLASTKSSVRSARAAWERSIARATRRIPRACARHGDGGWRYARRTH